MKVVPRRLKEMSYKTPFLGVINSKSLVDHELMDIFTRMCPQAWHIKSFEANTGQLEGSTLDSTVKYFDTLEHISALVQVSKPEGKRTRNDQDDCKTECHKNKNKESFSKEKKKFYQSYKDTTCLE